MSDAVSPRATVVITSRERPDELRRALESVRDQTEPLSVIVMDDGSTSPAVRELERDFPEARWCWSDERVGCVPQRNRAAALVQTPLVVWMDDDCVFGSDDVVARTVADFGDDPRIGVVAIPLLDFKPDPVERQTPPDEDGVWITGTYAGGACAMRVELFRQLGGYPGFIAENTEEAAYAMRLVAAGSVVRLGRGRWMEHRPAAVRDVPGRWASMSRNDVLVTWRDAPGRALPVRLAAVVVKLVGLGVRERRLGPVLRGLRDAVATIARRGVARDPVGGATWRLVRGLTHRPRVLADIENELAAR